MTGILIRMGCWLKVNGEAIYSTRPFAVYGEGPTFQTSERIFHAHQIKDFTPEDIRFTRNGSNAYAILLGWPYAGKASFKTMREGGLLDAKITRITMLGVDGQPLSYIRDETSLTVTLPREKPCPIAYTLKIETEDGR